MSHHFFLVLIGWRLFLELFEIELFQAVPKVKGRTVVDMLDQWFSKCGLLISSVSYLLEMQILGLTPKLLYQKLWVFGSAVCILTGFPGDSEAHPKSENYYVGWTAQRPVGLGPMSQGISHRGWDYLTSCCKDFGSCVKWEATVEGFELRHDVIWQIFLTEYFDCFVESRTDDAARQMEITLAWIRVVTAGVVRPVRIQNSFSERELTELADEFAKRPGVATWNFFSGFERSKVNIFVNGKRVTCGIKLC